MLLYVRNDRQSQTGSFAFSSDSLKGKNRLAMSDLRVWLVPPKKCKRNGKLSTTEAVALKSRKVLVSFNHPFMSEWNLPHPKGG